MAQQRETTPQDGRVTLNVGGTLYTTTRSTLLSEAGSFFTSLLSNDWEGDAQQQIFIDRDGDLFKHILRCMRESREGQLEVIETWTEGQRSLLLREANFFGLHNLCQLLKSHPRSQLEYTCVAGTAGELEVYQELRGAVSNGWTL